MTNSWILNNAQFGIVLFDNSTSKLTANTIYLNSGHGIVVDDNSSLEAMQNTIQDNRQRGISFQGNSKGTVQQNEIYRNGYGADNKDYWQGIGVEDSAIPNIEDNVIRENAAVGIQFLDASGGYVANNTLIGNAVNYDIYKRSQGRSEISSGGIAVGMFGRQYHPQPTITNNEYLGNVGGDLNRYE